MLTKSIETLVQMCISAHRRVDAPAPPDPDFQAPPGFDRRSCSFPVLYPCKDPLQQGEARARLWPRPRAWARVDGHHAWKPAVISTPSTLNLFALISAFDAPADFIREAVADIPPEVRALCVALHAQDAEPPVGSLISFLRIVEEAPRLLGLLHCRYLWLAALHALSEAELNGVGPDGRCAWSSLCARLEAALPNGPLDECCAAVAAALGLALTPETVAFLNRPTLDAPPSDVGLPQCAFLRAALGVIADLPVPPAPTSVGWQAIQALALLSTARGQADRVHPQLWAEALADDQAAWELATSAQQLQSLAKIWGEPPDIRGCTSMSQIRDKLSHGHQQLYELALEQVDAPAPATPFPGADAWRSVTGSSRITEILMCIHPEDPLARGRLLIALHGHLAVLLAPVSGEASPLVLVLRSPRGHVDGVHLVAGEHGPAVKALEQDLRATASPSSPIASRHDPWRPAHLAHTVHPAGGCTEDGLMLGLFRVPFTPIQILRDEIIRVAVPELRRRRARTLAPPRTSAAPVGQPLPSTPRDLHETADQVEPL